MSTFKPLSFAELVKNFDALAASELQKYSASGDFNQFIAASPVRASQMEFLDNLMTDLKGPHLSDEEKSVIFTGGLLYVMELISKTYQWPSLWSPNHSNVHYRIPATVGVTDSNLLDDEFKLQANDAFLSYVNKQANFRQLVTNFGKTDPMFIPVLKDKIAKNQEAMSALIQKDELSAQAEKLTKNSVANVSVFNKPLDKSQFVVRNVNNGRGKESIYSFFASEEKEPQPSAAIATEARATSSRRRRHRRK